MARGQPTAKVYVVAGQSDTCGYEATLTAATAGEAARQFLAMYPYVQAATAVAADDPSDTATVPDPPKD